MRHSYRVVTSRTFIVFDVARRLIEPDAACAEHQNSGDMKRKRSRSTRAAWFTRAACHSLTHHHECWHRESVTCCNTNNLLVVINIHQLTNFKVTWRNRRDIVWFFLSKTLNELPADHVVCTRIWGYLRYNISNTLMGSFGTCYTTFPLIQAIRERKWGTVIISRYHVHPVQLVTKLGDPIMNQSVVWCRLKFSKNWFFIILPVSIKNRLLSFGNVMRIQLDFNDWRNLSSWVGIP